MRQVLKTSQGQPRPALRSALSGHSRVKGFSVGTAKIIFIGSVASIPNVMSNFPSAFNMWLKYVITVCQILDIK